MLLLLSLLAPVSAHAVGARTDLGLDFIPREAALNIRRMLRELLIILDSQRTLLPSS
jgi:hypothetical protein